MAAITPKVADKTVQDVGLVAANAGGDTINPGDYPRVELLIQNTGAAALTVNVVEQTDERGHTTPTALTIPNSATAIYSIVLPNVNWYKSPTTGLINLTYSGVTGLKVGCVLGW